jgi:NAD-dependent dihydropyrimidine dehydrogenase PreA subunit
LFIILIIKLLKFVIKKTSKHLAGKGMLVQPEKCIGCMKCVNECPNNVFQNVNGKAEAVFIQNCSGCLGCVHRCPAGAISSVCGKLDNFQPYKFEEYFLNPKKGWVEIEELKKDNE